MQKTAIVLTAFGTATQARDTYDFIERKLRERYSDDDIFWAFSSRTVREKIGEGRLTAESPEQVLNKIKRKRYARIVLQSLHIVPGIEFEKVVQAARGEPFCPAVGKPLLSNEIDCHRVIDALASYIPDPQECITLLVGHGTHHSGGGAMYLLFEQCLRSRYPVNVYLSMVEGIPSWEATRTRIQKSRLQKIKIIPLMLVAGAHIMHDVLGDHEHAWQRELAGYHVAWNARGLGFDENILAVYFDHLAEALSRS